MDAAARHVIRRARYYMDDPLVFLELGGYFHFDDVAKKAHNPAEPYLEPCGCCAAPVGPRGGAGGGIHALCELLT